jgi:hypothetical protein
MLSEHGAGAGGGPPLVVLVMTCNDPQGGQEQGQGRDLRGV